MDVDSNNEDVDDIKEERSDFEEGVYETLKDGEELDDGVEEEDEESGVSLMLILLIIVLLILLGGGLYVYSKK